MWNNLINTFDNCVFKTRLLPLYFWNTYMLFVILISCMNICERVLWAVLVLRTINSIFLYPVMPKRLRQRLGSGHVSSDNLTYFESHIDIWTVKMTDVLLLYDMIEWMRSLCDCFLSRTTKTRTRTLRNLMTDPRIQWKSILDSFHHTRQVQ